MPCEFADRNKIILFLEKRMNPGEQQALVSHWESGCEECDEAIARFGPERFGDALARQLEDDSMDDTTIGTDEADRAFARIMSAVDIQSPSTIGPRHPGWLGIRWPVWAAAALSLAVFIIANPFLSFFQKQRQPETTQTTKAGNAVGVLELHVWFDVAQSKASHRRIMGRGLDGERLSAQDFLIFHVRLSQDAFLYLFKIAQDGQAEMIYESSAMQKAGTETIKAEGVEAAYPLKGNAGTLRFLAIAAPRPLDVKQLRLNALDQDVASSGFSIEVYE